MSDVADQSEDDAEPDVVEQQIAQDIWFARYQLRKATQALAHAERALELREQELQHYRSKGVIPKRKRVEKRSERERVRQEVALGIGKLDRGKA